MAGASVMRALLARSIRHWDGSSSSAAAVGAPGSWSPTFAWHRGSATRWPGIRFRAAGCASSCGCSRASAEGCSDGRVSVDPPEMNEDLAKKTEQVSEVIVDAVEAIDGALEDKTRERILTAHRK